ncbi:MAG TPA: DUF1786 domain-containing protein [Nitrolancea sp.]|nr:DUF1786 domain-containing protein [Nitrolancea sp.]
MQLPNPVRILAIDVGAGTQDILVYESDRSVENCTKLILPSQTQVVAAKIRQATLRRSPIYLAGALMGGGASSDAIEAHLAADLAVYAAPEAAKTVHNDLRRVEQRGVKICDSPPPGAEIIWLGDVDLVGIAELLARFGVPVPSLFAIAVQDHGFIANAGAREFRYEFLQQLLTDGGDLRQMMFRAVPEYMTRMRAVQQQLPGAVVMDTGAAAVLGILGDPVVARAIHGDGAVLVNIGNMHTFAIAVRGTRVFAIAEHHSGGITPTSLGQLVEQLANGRLTHEDVMALGGHGGAFVPDYADAAPFPMVAITGPNRALARDLGYYQAVPHGDMMLAGPYGLVEGMLRLLEREGYPTGLTLVAAPD